MSDTTPIRWTGPLALALVLLWRVVAHNVVVLEQHWLGESARLWFGAWCGAVGICLVWRGRTRAPLGASLHGLAGGALIWMGWFEHGFDVLARLMGVPPLMWNGAYVLPPNLILLQSSTLILVPLLLLFGMNADSGCRMFLWVRRRLALRPGQPSRMLAAQHARTAALEYLMVSWFMYAVILVLLDPRLLGSSHPATSGVLVGLIMWSAWLAVRAVPRQIDPAIAIRYAIGSGGIVWLAIELAAQLRWFPEVWVRPLEQPWLNAAFWLAFLAAAVLAARQPVRD